MKFLFLGAGAIGTYVGGSLAAAGDEVTFIERPETAAVIAEHGLKVHTADTTRVVRDVTVHGSAAEALAHGPYDIGVFALGTHPQKSVKKGAGDQDIPVTFGGVTFVPGHWLYADEDGVIVADAPLV